ncbi:MAG: 2OG-Fe(II) oxygenase family protein [Myxococcota bacterium]|nr:2OG-Fe(II) oxygenase family protein [Myxococcota bacterium]
MGASALSRISAIDEVLPAPVIGELRSQIIAAQARRPQAGDGGTHWYALDESPRLLFEQVIQHLRSFVPRGDEFIGAEWWLRATPTDTGFPFHFDRDEGIRSSIVSPGLASILYLSNAGGPTVILDATPTRTSAPKAGIAVHPRPGRLGMFPGTLLHGVLPGRPGRWPRVTMLVNWWRSVPRMECAPAHRSSTRASRRWRVDVERAKTSCAVVERIDPSRLLASAAWRDVISKQTTYR